METLNQKYNKFCKISYKNYNKISNDIIIIDNFFEDFTAARNFFTSREKWECTPYQNDDLPGSISFLPNWVGKSLIEKYIQDNKIHVNNLSYTAECTFRYYREISWSLSNSDYFPHIDDTQVDNFLTYICLINLNTIPIFTNFYSYKNKENCSEQLKEEWIKYDADLNKKIKKFYNDKKNISNTEIKSFLLNQKLDVKLTRKVKYNPNQAIIYPADLFHCAEVQKEFDKTNPRNSLRISFLRKMLDLRAIEYIYK